MRKVLVTGATGYLGSNLVRRLISQNYEVHVIVRKTSKFDLIDDIKDKLNIFVYDNDIESLIQYFEYCKPQVVYHLASLFISEHSFSDVGNLIDSNIKFGTEILEAMNHAGVTYLINTGTSWQHYNNERYNPVNLYAATKEAFEKIIEYYTNCCGFRVITLVLYDTYGPSDTRNKIISLIHNYAKKKLELKLSPGEQLLDLTYIDDVVNAYLVAESHLHKIESHTHVRYAIRSKERFTLREIVRLYEEVSGNKVLVEWGARPYRRREVMVPANCVETLPDWEPKISLREGLRLIIEKDTSI